MLFKNDIRKRLFDLGPKLRFLCDEERPFLI